MLRSRGLAAAQPPLTRQAVVLTPEVLAQRDALPLIGRVHAGAAVKPRRLRGETLDHFPAHPADQAAVEPIYEEIEGWPHSTAGARSWAQLPARAIKYIRRIEELIQCPVALVSTSPEREDTILVRDPFAD